jgi:hypothetical protein
MTGPEADSRADYVTIHTRRAEIRELFGRGTTGKTIPRCGGTVADLFLANEDRALAE